ncbi:MAG: cyclase family protein [Oscillospiraceae bacterium]|jgi:kynurenine formamidase|nr:cyclase family protein [Oscillospiraceae bacterium]
MAYMPLNKDEFYLDQSKMTKIWDLSQPWGVDTPLWPFPGARSDLSFPRGQYLERFHKRTMTYTGTLHAATHMDAPNHVLHEEEVDRERYGYNLAEIKLEFCIGTGVILDMTHLYDEFQEKFNAAGGDPAKMGEIWYELQPEDFEKAAAKDGLEIRENDWVVVDTGFHRFWRKNNDKYFNYYPGMGPTVAKWLLSKKIKGISGTWGATDAPLWHYPLKEQMPWLDTNYKLATGHDAAEKYPDYEPCHRLFTQHGVCTVENAGGDIDEVKGRRMIIAAFPFRCEMADGGFVRLVAWEEGSF